MTEKNFTSDRSTAALGMWVFLGSELLFFGGLFLSMTVYRHLYPEVFGEGTRHLSLWIGTINTALLLTSSASIAIALEKLSEKSPRKLLLLTLILGLAFLALKGLEYYQHAQEGLFPVVHWDARKFSDARLMLFFVLYFIMTGLHALHLIIGLCLISWLSIKSSDQEWTQKHEGLFHNTGLYWHFVDILWIFIFPLLYLIGRNL
jgi:cytochrome c oxidase subunit 3